jgi:hypothetical protein
LENFSRPGLLEGVQCRACLNSFSACTTTCSGVLLVCCLPSLPLHFVHCCDLLFSVSF